MEVHKPELRKQFRVEFSLAGSTSLLNISALRAVKTRSSVEVYRRFRETFCNYHLIHLSRNVVIPLKHKYAVSLSSSVVSKKTASPIVRGLTACDSVLLG
jgi:hypothetical protein